MGDKSPKSVDRKKKQEQVAKQMAEHPEKADQNREKQQEAINKLDEAIRNDPKLQDQPAQQLLRFRRQFSGGFDQLPLRGHG